MLLLTSVLPDHSSLSRQRHRLENTTALLQGRLHRLFSKVSQVRITNSFRSCLLGRWGPNLQTAKTSVTCVAHAWQWRYPYLTAKPKRLCHLNDIGKMPTPSQMIRTTCLKVGDVLAGMNITTLELVSAECKYISTAAKMSIFSL